MYYFPGIAVIMLMRVNAPSVGGYDFAGVKIRPGASTVWPGRLKIYFGPCGPPGQ